MLTFAPHPSLLPAAFITEFPERLGERPSPAELLALHHEPTGAVNPLASSPATAGAPSLSDEDREQLRQDVRDVLRHGGHKPTGRGKPSCEYLVRARSEGKIPSINLAVDTCNAVSVTSGLPISVIDLDRATAPFEVRVMGDESYIFNASGQEISLKGLLCLCDANGPIANAVKDSHATKTSPTTTRTLTVIWAPKLHEDHVQQTLRWHQTLLHEQAKAKTTPL